MGYSLQRIRNNCDKKLDRMLVVRITSDQYTKLLEAIVQEGKKGIKSPLNNMDKSKITFRNITDVEGDLADTLIFKFENPSILGVPIVCTLNINDLVARFEL
jgi:hypothetical protein